MNGRAGLERNFFQTSASKLKRVQKKKHFKYLAAILNPIRALKESSSGLLRQKGGLLFCIGDMFLHVVQSTLCDSFLKNEIF